MATHDEAVIVFNDVCKYYRVGNSTVKALDGVNLQIDRGEFLSVVGPSGSGKSTLLQLMGALDRPTSGQVLIEGTDVGRLSSAQMARLRGRRIGFVFQSYNLYTTLNAMGNVELPMMMANMHGPQRRARARELLERVGLGHRLRHMPSELSGGELQRVAIARSLANEPAFLLGDEPTGNVNTEQGREIMDLLDEVNEAGTTIIVVTHDPRIAARTQHTINIVDGRIKEVVANA